MRRAPPPKANALRRRGHESGRRAVSLPLPQEFSRDLQLIGLAAERPLQLGDLAPKLPLTQALLLAGQRPAAALEQLLAPAVAQRLRDRVLTANLLHRAVAAQASQHDLDLLLGRPTPVLALLAQPHLLVGRAAHPEPAAGQSLRRYAPPGLPGNPTQLPVNAGPGSEASRPRCYWHTVRPEMHYSCLRPNRLNGRIL